MSPLAQYVTAFLECVAPGELHTFQTFHDRVKDQPGPILHGTFEQHEQALLACQAAGHGVFWTINATNQCGRELTDITRVRCVWLDIDDAGRDITPICQALPPHCIVESSPGKWHLYWRVADCPLEMGAPLLDALVQRWAGDVGAKGLNRVLRLPGFAHLKGEPFTSRVVSWAPGAAPYTLADIQQRLLPGVPLAPAPVIDLDTDLHEGPVEGWRNTISDEKLTRKLNGLDPAPPSAAEAFAGKWSLHQLWAPDLAQLQAEGVRSEARMALLTRLLFLTGGDSKRVYDLVKNHELAVKDGREGLLLKELARARGVFLSWWEPEKARRDAQVAEAKALGDAEVHDAILPTVLTVEQMEDQFVHIAVGTGVVWRAGKKVYRFHEAADVFAASQHEYVEQKTGEIKTKPAIQSWKLSTKRRSAGTLTWRPGASEFCAAVNANGGHVEAYNTWRGLQPLQAPANWRDWAGWFEHHVAYLVPIEEERRTFLQWLAHIVQAPGELPHTAYLMVTETTGTGRNWLSGVLARALRGYVALGVSVGPILDGKFNGILSEKLLATVDEVREGMDGDRFKRAEALKSLVNQEVRQIDHKYGLQVVEKNCCRWLFFSNHHDALPFDNNDRRLIVIDNPVERRDEAYYTTLYGLLKEPLFIASVREYLATLSLEGFNPGRPAPMSLAKARALEAMTPGIDRAVREFKARWQSNWATVRDLKAAICEATGENPKDSALQHAMKRCGILHTGLRFMMDGVRERAIAWGIDAEVARNAPQPSVQAAITAARKADAE